MNKQMDVLCCVINFICFKIVLINIYLTTSVPTPVFSIEYVCKSMRIQVTLIEVTFGLRNGSQALNIERIKVILSKIRTFSWQKIHCSRIRCDVRRI